ncbi:MAG: type II secretion system inner membrane protein GspF [Thiotrichales bacterium]
MPAYEFVALKPNGREEKGILEGDSARQIRQLLRERGVTPLEVQEIREGPALGGGGRLRTYRMRLRANDLALLTRQLATLLRAGTPLDEALGAIARQSHKSTIKRVITAVRAKVLEGFALADSLNQFPGVFPNMFRATVAAGEHAGQLDAVLERLADYTENSQAMQQKITSALIYPILLTVISIAVVSGLLGYVVPQVVQVFTSIGGELPLLTRMLIAVSEAVKNWGPYVLVLLVLAGFAFGRMYRRAAFQRKVDRATLSVPLVGNLLRGKNAAAFARTLSILAASGVPILTALRNSAEVIGNLPMREAVEDAAERVREGASLSASLQRSGLFPPMTIHLIASGEGSGKLEEMLARAADQQERETSTLIGAALSLFEPLLILIMGAVVLVIVLAILLPIFELNQLVK